MDRAMVHPATAERCDTDELRYVYNLPFELVPEGFVQQLHPRTFSYEEYLEMCPVMNSLRTYWNLVWIDSEGRGVAVMWGTYDLLEKTMHIVRVSVHPQLFTYKGKFLHQLYTTVLKVADENHMQRIYFISDKWRGLTKKLMSKTFKVLDAKVVEVI